MLHSIDSTTPACLNHFVSERDLSLMPFIASLRTSQIMHCQVSSLPKLFWKMVALKLERIGFITKIYKAGISLKCVDIWRTNIILGIFRHPYHFTYSSIIIYCWFQKPCDQQTSKEFWSQKIMDGSKSAVLLGILTLADSFQIPTSFCHCFLVGSNSWSATNPSESINPWAEKQHSAKE